MTYETAKIGRKVPIVWITLNRPDKRNVMRPQNSGSRLNRRS